MKYTAVLALAAVGSAFVVPSQEVFAEIAEQPESESWFQDAVATKDSLWSSLRKSVDHVSDSFKHAGEKAFDTTSNAIDDALSSIELTAHDVSDKLYDTAFDAESWLESEMSELEEDIEDFDGPPPPHHEGPPPPHHDGPPPPHHDDRPRPPHHKKPHHKRPHHKRPHHGHHKPNLTIYELINKSKYTTKLAFFINSYPDLVKTLNSTKANYTLFAPTDKAFEKIPEHAPKPSKEELEALLSYHVVDGFYPAGRVLASHTVPTLLKSKSLGKEPLPQRLSFHLSFRGLTVNFYSRIIAINIPATNGVIHGVDSIIIPPPPAIKIIDLLPGEFSTLELGLGKTGLLDKLNTTKHAGGTLFAPSNRAFAKLGPRINAFLFSERGLKYLKALLEYHVVPNNTLYSDAFYSADAAGEVSVPRGRFHVDLPTLLEKRSLSIDISRFGGFIKILVNGFSRVVVQDGIAKDGVIHVVGDVLIPPRKLSSEDESSFWSGEEMEVDELIERLEPYVVDYEL